MGYLTPDVYYSPEKFGLEIVGEIQWTEPNYSFDLTVVWRRLSDGQFFYASDSGCSCPSPFEDYNNVEELEAVSAWELQSELEGISSGYSHRDRENHAMDIANLMSTVMSRV